MPQKGSSSAQALAARALGYSGLSTNHVILHETLTTCVQVLGTSLVSSGRRNCIHEVALKRRCDGCSRRVPIDPIGPESFSREFMI